VIGLKNGVLFRRNWPNKEIHELHGICRVVGVSMKWLMGFIVECYESAPEDLNARVPECPKDVIVRCLAVEADELLSFVGKKTRSSSGSG
jgi:hypothetical protein